MSTAERIKERLAGLGWSEAELARRVGVSQQTIWKLTSGQSQTSRHMRDIAKHLATTQEYLLEETDDASPAGLEEPQQAYRDQPRDDTGEVEIIGIDLRYGLGGTFVNTEVEETRMRFPLSWIRQFTDAPPGMLRWTAGVGNSMEPTIGDGEPILIDMRVTETGMGDLIWVFALGEVGMVKRLRPLPNGTIKILSDNRNVPEEIVERDDINIIGRVCGVMKRL